MQTEAPVVIARGPSPEDIRKANAEIETFATALRERPSGQLSVREWTQRRAALALSVEYAEALAALERNPGCLRASTLAESNVQRRAATLRSLYVEQSL